jgi:hypothetical protein
MVEKVPRSCSEAVDVENPIPLTESTNVAILREGGSRPRFEDYVTEADFWDIKAARVNTGRISD